MAKEIVEDLLTCVVFAVVFGAAIAIPAIPGAILWFYLHPVTFWEKLAWFIVSLIVYIVVFGVERKILERVARKWGV